MTRLDRERELSLKYYYQQIKHRIMLKLLVILLLNIATVNAQEIFFVASDSMITNNVLNLGANEGWRFQAGDNPQWADPDFDDSKWIAFKPAGLSQPIPDSLWQGYGWFRFRFAADSTIYNKDWSLYFFTWGAADVYLDGKLIKSYGKVSSDRRGEILYMPYGKVYPDFFLTPNESHVLAVRFSYHQGSQFYKLLGKHSVYFGFGIGLGTEGLNYEQKNFRDSSLRISYISSAMLMVIVLLHGFLFFLFPGERSNLYIAIIAALLFMHSILAFAQLFFELNRLQYFLFRQIPFILLTVTAFSLFPVALRSMFNQKQKRTYKILIILIPFISSIPFIFSVASIIVLGAFALIILFFSVGILIRALKQGEKGVLFVAAGFLGTLISAFIALTYESIIPTVSWEILSFFINMVYISLPLGMTLFMAYRFHNLFTSLEHKVEERTIDLKKSLDNLRSTQSQLIHAEKMASLGELTAGIAHEIQNPLNFVNNFSEVSNELVEELKGERSKGEGERNEAMEEEILNDIAQNLLKINHHGKRADAIVKGMLQHSRTSSGVKEPTDINALADEYLRLSYHGLRAKDKSFNAGFKTEFDPTLPKINVIPQDIGRVLLNLINNAFYAVNARKTTTVETRHALSLPQTSSPYKPTVTVSTKNLGDRIEISVKDNGNGIPDEIKDKIFQPFFTTKPTGQGTGLGLSLSYDIVKAHGGELKVETNEGEGSSFIIQLPI
jgi:two-component system, NtrC family, sensor kinase